MPFKGQWRSEMLPSVPTITCKCLSSSFRQENGVMHHMLFNLPWWGHRGQIMFYPSRCTILESFVQGLFSGMHKKAWKVTFEAFKANFPNKLWLLEANGGHKCCNLYQQSLAIKNMHQTMTNSCYFSLIETCLMLLSLKVIICPPISYSMSYLFE